MRILKNLQFGESLGAWLTPFLLGTFWLFALLNPWFKKYDYGAGFPLVLIFCVLLLIFAISQLAKRRERALIATIFALIFMGAVVVSFSLSEAKNIGYPEVLAYLSVFNFYLIFGSGQIPWRNALIKVLLFGGFLAAVLGLIIYVFSDQTRMIGPFFNLFYHANEWPNGFALFLVMVWPLALIFLCKNRSIWERLREGFLRRFWSSRAGSGATQGLLGRFFSEINIAYFLLIPLLLGCLLLTFSRGAALAAGGQIFLLAIYFIWRFRWRWLLPLAISIAIIFGIFVGANYLRSLNHPIIDVGERINFGNNEVVTSKQERVDFWLGAIELIKEDPLFGHGPFSFRYAYNAIQKSFLGASDHPHNLFLKIGVENGLIALGAFLAFLAVIFLTVAARFFRLEQERRDQVYILFTALAGAFAHNLIDYNLNFFANLLLLFLLLAFIRSLTVSVVVKSDENRGTGNFISLFLAILIGFFAIFDGYLLVVNQIYSDKNGPAVASSNYLRNLYLDAADLSLSEINTDRNPRGEEEYARILKILEKHLALNPLDAQAYYLKGVINCRPELRNLALCEENFQRAIELNPMNDFNYYLDYLRVLYEQGKTAEAELILKDLLRIIDDYFLYVRDNVHFTAFTHNLFAWSDLIDLLHGQGILGPEVVERKNQALIYADEQHGSRYFMVK